MDWMIASVRAMAFSSTCAPLSAPAFMPGIMPAISSRVPMPLSCDELVVEIGEGEFIAA